MFRSLINKAKKKLHLHQSGALKECKPGKHINEGSMAQCADMECGKDICENCFIQAPNQNFYCMQCFGSKPELQTELVSVEEDEDVDDMFSFDSSSRDSRQNTFTKVGVQIDKQTGQFIGFDRIYEMANGTNSASG